VPLFPPRPDDPRLQVSAALRALGLAGDDARRAVSSTLEWLNAVPSARALVEEIRRHPLIRRPGPIVLPPPSPALTLAQAIIDARPFETVLALAAVPGVDVAALSQLIHVGAELAPPRPPDPVVGVLAPLRLETRFTPPSGLAGWQLRVRIVPDAPSIDRFDPVPSDIELDSTELMWRNCGGVLASDQGAAEWARFAARHGASRAAWLARTFPPVLVGGEFTITRPAVTRTDPRVSALAGLPEQLELWLARGGAAPARAATLTVDRSALSLEFPDPDSGVERWWMSFKEAVNVGLGAQIDLGARADDIDALYVIGLGGGDPAGLFGAHRDDGSLSLLTLGEATNAVDGEPAADLARDAETWRRLITDPGTAAAGTEAVSFALTGRPDALKPLPGADSDPQAIGRALVAALWASVFGHGLKDVLGLGPRVHDAGVWALENLCPEGPVPPIRIGDQPYGIVPVTSLAAWKPAPGDPPVEEAMRPSLERLRASCAAAAEKRGTAVGADTDRLLELLSATPSSFGYSWRWMLPLALVHGLGWAYGTGTLWADEVKWWDTVAAQVLSYPVAPHPRYTAIGFPQDLAIPLVEPDNLEQGLRLEDVLKKIAAAPPGLLVSGRELFRRMPNSLLVRLILMARILTAAEVHRKGTGDLLEPPFVATTVASVIHTATAQMTPADLGGDPQSMLFEAARAGTKELTSFPYDVIERAFRAVLDTASHRLDPWVTGFAWRRLRALASPEFQLGAYGWVDSPAPRAPAFDPELLHAPSQEQALTAAILRDRNLSDDEPARWHMDLHSDRVRVADALAAEVRLGAHLSEALGRAVERAVGGRTAVENLRTNFPIRTEHGGRRVCDGPAVLAQFADDPSVLGLTAGQLAGLAPLAEALDAYGDLLVADAVFDVVSGRGEVAGASMDAAAGLSVPPVLDVIRTQREGRAVTTSLLTALPDAAAPAVGADSSPGRIADAAVAAFLDTAFGAAASSAWTWDLIDDGGGVIGSISLDDLGLAPIDTVGLAPADLAAAAIETSGAAGVKPEKGLDAHARARRTAELLAARPAVPSDFGGDDDDSAVLADLATRYADLKAAAATLLAAMSAAATDADRAAVLRDALRWGITPLVNEGDTLALRVTRAQAALAARVAAAPAAAGLSVADLTRAIARLAASEGPVAVFARIALDDLPALSGEATLEREWLEIVSAVRAPAAKLEAYQLERRAAAEPAFAAWSSQPGDPWQAALAPGAITGLVPSTRLVAAFGPSGVLDPGADPTRPVALGLLDGWSETIPSTEHATSVAFHFDAPGARAPQAILVAVPPVADQPLDTAMLVQILAETRELAHARMADPRDLDAFAAGVPLTVVPANPPAGVNLLPD
jgi:hypothetical protein